MSSMEFRQGEGWCSVGKRTVGFVCAFFGSLLCVYSQKLFCLSSLVTPPITSARISFFGYASR